MVERTAFPAWGLGGAALGNLYRAVSTKDAVVTVHAALAGGMRLIDTAPYYGHGLSETRIGAALRSWKGAWPMLSTKVGRTLDPVAPGETGDFGFVNPMPFRPRFDYSRDAVWLGLNQSLVRLGVNRLDIALVHDVGHLTHGADHPRILRQVLDEALPLLHAARAQGLIRYIGVGVNEWEVCAEILAHAELDVILLAGRYTLLEQGALDFLDTCVGRGVRVMAAGVFNSGLLASFPSAASTYDYRAAPSGVVARAQALWDVCARHHVAPQAAALQFPAAHPAVATVLAGARNTAEIADIVNWQSQVIPDALWAELKSLGFIAEAAPLPRITGETRPCA